MRWKAALALVCALASAAAAQVDPDALAQEVQRLVAVAQDTTLPADQRRAAQDKAVELRRDLIANAGGDTRLGSWMIDQGAALLESLSEDGADTAVLFDADLLDQRQRVRAVVDDAQSLFARARAALERAAGTLEKQGDIQEAANLRQVERDVRLAFFHARASLLGAALASGEEREKLARDVISALAPLDLEGAAEAARRTNLGLAMRFGGDVRQGARVLGRAMELAWAGEAPRRVACEAALGLALCEAAIGDVDSALARIDRVLSEPPVMQDGRVDGALASVGLIVRGRVMLERRPGDAFSLHVALLDKGLAGIEPDVSRWLILACMARATRDVEDLSVLPAQVAFARAIAAAQDASRRDEAIALLGAVAERAKGDQVGADALWELGVLLLNDGSNEDVRRAVVVLTELARRRPDTTRGAQALGAALAHGLSLVDANVPDADDALDAALDVLVQDDVHVKDHSAWLLEAARRSLLAGRTVPALDALEDIPPDDARASMADELYHAAANEAIRASWADLREARRFGRSERVAEIAESRLAPLSLRAAEYARQRDLLWLSWARVELADARVEMGEPGARVLYQSLLDAGRDVPGGDARLLVGLGRSLLLAGERERAFAALRKASDLFGRMPPEDPAGRDRFWQCWTLILEMLVDANADGAHTGTIVAHAVRLESVDPNLGGPPWRDRIQAARKAAGG